MFNTGTPVLAVALEVVRNVEGPEPLSSLLTLFSKCKEQLQDGPRLENMCWRLWHQEHVASYSASDCSSSSCGRSDEDSVSEISDCSSEQGYLEQEGNCWKSNSFRTCSTVSDHPLSRRHSHSSATEAHSSRRSSSTASQKPFHICGTNRLGPVSRRSQSAYSPGKIMAELIPDKLIVRTVKNKPIYKRQDWSSSSSILNIHNDIMVGAVLTEEPKEIHYSSPPAINFEMTASLKERSTRLLPQVQIVNPTPHPTPPMTPQMSPPSLVLGLVKQDRLVVPARSAPLTLSTGKSPAPVLQLEPSQLSPTVARTHALSHSDHVCSTNVKISLPLSPPVTATSTGSSDSHHHYGQAQLTAIDRSYSAKPLSALPPRSSDHKFYIAQNGDSPDSQHHFESGSSIISGGIASQRSNSHSDANSKDYQYKHRRISHEIRHSQSNGRLNVLEQGQNFSNLSDGAISASNAVIQPSSVTSTRSQATTKSHASSGSSNANRVFARNSKRGKDSAARPGLRRANTHTSTVHNRQHTVATHRSKLTRTNSSQSNVQRLATVAPAALSRLTHQQEPQPPVNRDAKAIVAGPSKQSRESKAQSPQKKDQLRNQPRLTLASFSSGYETTDDSEDSWTDEIEQAAQKNQQNKLTTEVDLLKESVVHEEQRRRDMFTKVDRKSYTELSMKRTQSGLLSSLLRQDPSLFSEGQLYRLTRSTQDIAPYKAAKQIRYSTPAPLQAGKSPAAGPITISEAAVGNNVLSGSNGRSKLRLKGRPEGEIEESESEDDDAENTIQMSNSLAVQRLAILHGRRSSSTAPPTARQQSPYQSPPVPTDPTTTTPPPAHVAAPIPVTLAFPYNLPPPMPPSTPRTTRRHMLSNELSESLRRNLLWERQVSKLRPIRKQSSGMVDNGVRPVFATISARTSANASSTNGDGDSIIQDSREEERRMALARHRTWAAEFNGAGW